MCLRESETKQLYIVYTLTVGSAHILKLESTTLPQFIAFKRHNAVTNLTWSPRNCKETYYKIGVHPDRFVTN